MTSARDDYLKDKPKFVFLDDWLVYGMFPGHEVRYISTELWPEWNEDENNDAEIVTKAKRLSRKYWDELPEDTTPEMLSELYSEFAGSEDVRGGPPPNIWDTITDPGKFEGQPLLAKLLYEADDPDKRVGSASLAGYAELWAGLPDDPPWNPTEYMGYPPAAAILVVDTQGFVTVLTFEDQEEAYNVFEIYAEDFEEDEYE